MGYKFLSQNNNFLWSTNFIMTWEPQHQLPQSPLVGMNKRSLNLKNQTQAELLKLLGFRCLILSLTPFSCAVQFSAPFSSSQTTNTEILMPQNFHGLSPSLSHARLPPCHSAHISHMMPSTIEVTLSPLQHMPSPSNLIQLYPKH